MSEEPERRRSSTDPEAPNHDSKSKPGAKPRASRAGTRSVSTLNAEQLARKRANDREAQRAIRQRTREHIERLENRIKELSENSPESDGALEAMQRRNSELEEELRQLKRTLFGMGEGSNSPGGSHNHAFVQAQRSKIPTDVAYNAQPQWNAANPQMGAVGFAPTSNPLPEAEPSWHAPLQTSGHSRQSHSHHQRVVLQQSLSWNRTDSSESDYDSGYGQRVDHPVAVYPEHIPDYIVQQSHGGRNDNMWQTPSGSSGLSTPYEAHAQLPNNPAAREEPHTYVYGSAPAPPTGNQQRPPDRRHF